MDLHKHLNANKSTMFGSLNTQTLTKVWKMPELIAYAEKTNQEIICIQEYRFVYLDIDIKEHTYGKWKLITCSTWRNSMNAATVSIGSIVNTR